MSTEVSSSSPKALRTVIRKARARLLLPLNGMTAGLRETVANIGWMGYDRLLRMGGALLVGTVVARSLGPASFGILNYALAIFGLFNVISNLGLDLLVVRDVAGEPIFEDEILGTAFLLKVSASLVTTSAAIAFTKFSRPTDLVTLQIVAMLSFAAISQGFDVVEFFLQAKTKSRLAILPKSAVFLMASAARLVAVIARRSVLTFAWIAAAEILLNEGALAFAYFRYHKQLRRWEFNRSRALLLLKESWPLMSSSLLTLLYMRSDQILLGMLVPPSAVGTYSVAVRLSEVWYAIPVIICASVMPKLMKHKKNNLQLYISRLQRLYDLMAGASILLAVLVTLTSKYIVLLVYGSKYDAASPILSVQVWTGIFVFLGVVGGQQMVYENLTITALQRSAFGAALNIGLNVLLIPRFGAMGSSIATLTVYGIVAYGLDLADPRTRHIFRMKTRAYLQMWAFDQFHWRNKGAAA